MRFYKFNIEGMATEEEARAFIEEANNCEFCNGGKFTLGLVDFSYNEKDEVGVAVISAVAKKGVSTNGKMTELINCEFCHSDYEQISYTLLDNTEHRRSKAKICDVTFTAAELKEFPFLPYVLPDMQVVGIDYPYQGLVGTITSIVFGEELKRATETDASAVFEVEFDAQGKNLEETNPGLNGTTISGVLMSFDEIGVFFPHNCGLAVSLRGKAVCPSCHKEIEKVFETTETVMCFDFVMGEYVQNKGIYDDPERTCGNCGAVLPFDKDKTFCSTALLPY